MKQEDIDDFLTFHAYVTAKQATKSKGAAFANLPMESGRPDFDKLLERLASTYGGTDIGVFHCGPPALGKSLYKLCNKYSKSTRSGFFFHNGTYISPSS